MHQFQLVLVDVLVGFSWAAHIWQVQLNYITLSDLAWWMPECLIWCAWGFSAVTTSLLFPLHFLLVWVAVLVGSGYASFLQQVQLNYLYLALFVHERIYCCSCCSSAVTTLLLVHVPISVGIGCSVLIGFRYAALAQQVQQCNLSYPNHAYLCMSAFFAVPEV